MKITSKTTLAELDAYVKTMGYDDIRIIYVDEWVVLLRKEGDEIGGRGATILAAFLDAMEKL